MSNGIKFLIIGIIILFVVLFIALAIVTRSQALDIVNHPPVERPKMEKDPGDYGMVFEAVSVTTEDGLKLYGWYIPGKNGAAIMIQHGTPGGRQDGLYEADFLNEAGYGILMGSFRAHDECEGELISFGYHEQKDLAAWHQYLLSRDDVDPKRIGLFGESMGGGTSILYTAKNPGIRALATGSGFALTQEVVVLFLKFDTDLPPALIPLLARFILFWAERGADFKAETLDTQAVIAQISPVPILIIHGGKDDKIGPNVGKQLFEAAAEPKELVRYDKAGHVNFEDFYPEEYQATLVGFFDQNLLDH